VEQVLLGRDRDFFWTFPINFSIEGRHKAIPFSAQPHRVCIFFDPIAMLFRRVVWNITFLNSCWFCSTDERTQCGKGKGREAVFLATLEESDTAIIRLGEGSGLDGGGFAHILARYHLVSVRGWQVHLSLMREKAPKGAMSSYWTESTKVIVVGLNDHIRIDPLKKIRQHRTIANSRRKLLNGKLFLPDPLLINGKKPRLIVSIVETEINDLCGSLREQIEHDVLNETLDYRLIHCSMLLGVIAAWAATAI
jgi:hypothetical protein